MQDDHAFATCRTSPAAPLAVSVRRRSGRSARLRARSGGIALARTADASPRTELELTRSYRRTAASCTERIVAVTMGVAVDALHARTRCAANVAWARQVAMYLTHCVFQISQTEVGARFGRDRTTVKHACRRVEDMRDDPTFEARLCEIEALLREIRVGMQAFALHPTTASDRLLIEVGAKASTVEDRR